MNDLIGIAWYKDEPTYRRAMEIFADSANMPATYHQWGTLVKRELEEIKAAGNIALRVDINPETFPEWCNLHGHRADAIGRTAYVTHREIEYRKTGEGETIE